MRACHYWAGIAIAASVGLTFFGIFKGAAIFVCLATAIELTASAIFGKSTNT
jgi:hypothetical protein